MTQDATSRAVSLALPSEAATAELGARLAALLRPGDIVALTGDLGAGKTALTRAVIQSLPLPDGGRAEEEVPSPTFTLVQTYERAPAPVWHFDLYRLSEPDEALELGFEEALAEGVVFIEWPDRLGALLPAERLDITLAYDATGDGRMAVLQGGVGWAERLRSLAP